MAWLTILSLFVCYSIGMTLTDMLDELIGEQRMDPQLAMKILSNFDRAITETLNDKVKARLTFKVNTCQHTDALLRPVSFVPGAGYREPI